jgi:hypothetical protein
MYHDLSGGSFPEQLRYSQTQIEFSAGDSYIQYKKMGRLKSSTSYANFETSQEGEAGRDLCSLILLALFMVFSMMVVSLARLDLLA